MPTRAVFRCQFCDAVPDHGTQRSLQGQVTERMFGEYLDAFPGRWLVWNGGGPLGPRRYACRKHRGDLVAYLRYHYATVAAQVWKRPPYEQRWPDEKRPHMGGSMGIVKFGLRGGLLQDAPPAAKSPRDPAVEPAATTPTPPPAAPPPAGEETALPPVGDMFPPGELFVPDAAVEPPATPLPAPPPAGEERELPPVGDMFPPGELFIPDELCRGEDPPWDDAWPPPPPPPPDAEPPPAA